MWIATVDFAKAFDTIKHKALWTALAQFGIEPQYISLLKLYAELKGCAQRSMMCTESVGLNIHPEKITFSANTVLNRRKDLVTIDNMGISLRFCQQRNVRSISVNQ